MKFHALCCALCDAKYTVVADSKKKLMFGCEKCQLWTPAEQVVSLMDKVTYGNHLKGKEEKEVPKAGRDRLKPKS